MRGPREERIESAVDRVAAAVFAAAVGFSIFGLLLGRLSRLQLFACIGVAIFAAFLMTARFLRGIRAHSPVFELRTFEFPEFGFAESEELLLTDQVELLLTDADRLRPTRKTAEDELILDDILAKLGPNSRVVRLFDPAAMPTPGQLNARIERHLRAEEGDTTPTDASEALHQALAELRRSLR